MVSLEAIIHVQRELAVYAPGPSDITPELVPFDGIQRHPPEHVTFPVDVVVVTGVVVDAGVVVTGVVVGAGVLRTGVVVVVRFMKHNEAVKPAPTPL